MKYTFSFKEINTGSVAIDSDHTPDRTEVIAAIMNGNAFYKDTKYEEIRFAETERPTPKNEREAER